MPRTVPLSAPRDNPFARYPSIRFTREENPPDEEELFLDEVSEEYSQTQTSLSNRRKKTSFIPPLPLIKAGAPAGEATERLAAELAEKKRQELVTQRESFITETVFSDPVGAKVQALRDAQAAGYSVMLVFLCVDSPELTALRVESRVKAGGHGVPPDKIAARYERMQQNVKTALTFVDFAIVVDNSSLETPLRPVAATAKGKVIHRNPPLPEWAEKALPEH